MLVPLPLGRDELRTPFPGERVAWPLHTRGTQLDHQGVAPTTLCCLLQEILSHIAEAKASPDFRSGIWVELRDDRFVTVNQENPLSPGPKRPLTCCQVDDRLLLIPKKLAQQLPPLLLNLSFPFHA